MITIWFEPHSTTIDNEAGVGSGWNDVDLSEKGLLQAEEMVARNKTRGISAIFCSDLQRAVKTAIPTARELRVPMYADERLRECNYGDFTLKDKELIEAERLGRISTAFPNGESYQQCIDRIRDFLDYLKTNFDGKTVLIIGHRATHFGLDHVLQNEPIEECVTKHWKWQPGWKYEVQ